MDDEGERLREVVRGSAWHMDVLSVVRGDVAGNGEGGGGSAGRGR